MPKRRKRRTLSLTRVSHGTQAFSKKGALIGIAMWLLDHWRGVGSLLLAGLLFVWSGEPVLAGMGLLVAYGLARWRPAKRKARWWDEATLAAAFVDAGVLKMAGEKLPSLSYKGRPQHSEHGTTVVVGLPQAKGLDDVNARRLAAALRVPAARLAVTQDEDDPANVIHVHVGEASKSVSKSVIADAASTKWSDPIRIGYDPRGQAVYLATDEHNTLAAGRPGSGKTTNVSQPVLGHFLLDPTTSIYLLDGKGSVDDYGAARAMCETFVSGVSDEAVSETLAMLNDILDLVRARNAKGGDHPGVLLLLEEFQDVRAAASRDARDRLDSTLGRIVRMGRAVSVHVLVSTQRPTTDDLPAGTRNLLSQRVALMLRNAADAGLVLGTAPSLALPKRRGQALFTDGGPVVSVELDRLDDVAWRKVCRRAVALRTPARPTLTLAPPPVAGLPGEGLVSEVVAILAEGDKLSATELHSRLSPEVRDGMSVRDLGVLLGRHRELVEPGWTERGRAWRLVEGADSVGRGV